MILDCDLLAPLNPKIRRVFRAELAAAWPKFGKRPPETLVTQNHHTLLSTTKNFTRRVKPIEQLSPPPSSLKGLPSFCGDMLRPRLTETSRIPHEAAPPAFEKE
jgi:hypothetical protein